ncbi:MAG TPA: EamA family transporter [Candidatus Paceibacterota bacterium]|nr:EamA family transporter [Candidatus Paceibacterota bacterium]
MGILSPLIASFLQAASYTFDKAALNVRRIDWKTYTSVSFPLLMLFDALFLFIVRPAVDWGSLGGLAGVFVFVTIIVGFITNALYYRALDDEDLHELQTWGVFIAIPTLIVTSILFTDERKLVVLIPALIATAAVTWSHLGKGNGLAVRPKTVAFIGWMIVATPAMAGMSKVILQSWNPILLELVRDSSLALIFWIAVSKGISHVNRKAWSYLLATNMLSSAAWILYYYGYQQIGIVHTMLLFSLAPVLTYLFSLIFLREKFQPRRIVAFVIVLASIAAAQLLR